VDTDVVAAALLGEPETGDEAARLLAARWELFAPAHWKAELCNVLWKAVRLGRIPREALDDILSLAEALPIISVDVGEIWRGAVARAHRANHPAYDVLFVTSVASYDRQFQGHFPAHVKRPRDLLTSP
jgi:predicted nucleic acid-binding protein